MHIDILKSVIPLMTGATLGATTRHLATRNIAPQIALRRICIINTAGSFLLGATQSFHKANRISAPVALALGTGFCGALTTFSTFSSQVFDLVGESSRRNIDAGAYVVISVVLGVAAVACGRKAARLFVR